MHVVEIKTDSSQSNILTLSTHSTPVWLWPVHHTPVHTSTPPGSHKHKLHHSLPQLRHSLPPLRHSLPSSATLSHSSATLSPNSHQRLGKKDTTTLSYSSINDSIGCHTPTVLKAPSILQSSSSVVDSPSWCQFSVNTHSFSSSLLFHQNYAFVSQLSPIARIGREARFGTLGRRRGGRSRHGLALLEACL